MTKKLGFSASRCIADLVLANVNFDDVVMITAGTKAPDRDAWQSVIQQYINLGYFADHDAAMAIGMQLWDAGLIHQPRLANDHYGHVSRFVWMDLVHTKHDRDSNPVLKEAWQEILVLESLITGSTIDDDMKLTASSDDAEWWEK